MSWEKEENMKNLIDFTFLTISKIVQPPLHPDYTPILDFLEVPKFIRDDPSFLKLPQKEPTPEAAEWAKEIFERHKQTKFFHVAFDNEQAYWDFKEWQKQHAHQPPPAQSDQESDAIEVAQQQLWDEIVSNIIDGETSETLVKRFYLTARHPTPKPGSHE